MELTRFYKHFSLLIFLFFCNVGLAKSDLHNKTTLEQYQLLFEKQQQNFEKQQKLIIKQGKEIEKLKSRLDAMASKPEKKQRPIRKKTAKPLATAKKTDKTSLPTNPVGQAPPENAETQRPPEIPRISDTVGGVLTRKGNFVIEPSLKYSYSDNNRVLLDAFTFLPAIAIGLIDLREIKRHTFVASLGARYGITNRLELEVKMPYIYRDDSQRSREISIDTSDDKIFNADGNDIGDFEISARYQLNSGANGWPIFIGNLTTTIPTGTSPFDVEFIESSDKKRSFPTELPTGSGFFSVQPSITALYPTDPGVFFGNLSYGYNAETNESIGKIDPGDSVGLSFGLGFSLNERSSFTLGYSHKHVFESKINKKSINGSELDIGQLLIGYSFRFSPKTNINLSLEIGATDDAQDVKLNLRVPMTFDFLSQISTD